MQDPVRVLIVDDSAFMRRAVERMLTDSPAVSVVGTATNGEEAVTLACQLHPDVIVMDVNMPEMDGLEALRQVMKTCPTPVLMMSTLTRAGAEVTVRALQLGAVDFIDKSRAGMSMDIYQLGPQLRDKVLAVARADVTPVEEPADAGPAPGNPATPLTHPFIQRRGDFDVVAIGTSTGGPRALSEILRNLPAALCAGLVIAQHMPSGFTATLAERLDERSPMGVREAVDGDVVEHGVALIAPGGKQMRVERVDGRLVVRVTAATPPTLHHPSVDVLLESVAAAAGRRAVGVVLTGMGQDGAVGLRKMRDAGARTLVESPETAVIYGMPRAARGAAELELPLHRIPQYLVDLCATRADVAPRSS